MATNNDEAMICKCDSARDNKSVVARGLIGVTESEEDDTTEHHEKRWPILDQEGSASELYAVPVCRLIIVLLFQWVWTIMVLASDTSENAPFYVILLGPTICYLAFLSAGKITRECESRNCCAHLDDKDIEDLASLCQ